MEQPERPDLAGLDRRRARVAQACSSASASRRMPARSATTRSPRAPSSGAVDAVPFARLAPDVEGPGRVAGASPKHGTLAASHRPPGGRQAGDGLHGPAGGDVLDRPAQELEAGRVEVVRPRPDPLRLRERPVEAGGERLARHQDDVGSPVDELEVLGVADQRRDDLDAGRARQRQRLADVVRAAIRTRRPARPASRPAARRSRGRARRSPARPASPRPGRGRRPATWASSAWNVVVATRS